MKLTFNLNFIFRFNSRIKKAYLALDMCLEYDSSFAISIYRFYLKDTALRNAQFIWLGELTFHGRPSLTGTYLPSPSTRYASTWLTT